MPDVEGPGERSTPGSAAGSDPPAGPEASHATHRSPQAQHGAAASPGGRDIADPSTPQQLGSCSSAAEAGSANAGPAAEQPQGMQSLGSGNSAMAAHGRPGPGQAEAPQAGVADSSSTGGAGTEEHEPRLKYHRLGSDTDQLLTEDAATCLCASDKLLALGTRQGLVYILDYSGDKVDRFNSHTGPVHDLSFDETTDFLASCSEDGSIVVRSLYTQEVSTFKHNKAVLSVALDPHYGSRKTREFFAGGKAGQLTLNSRGWLGAKDHTVHFGEGAIRRIRWAGSLVAWANNLGIKVYDVAVHSRIGFVERPAPGPDDASTSPSLFWEGDWLLYIGWTHAVQVARVRRPNVADPEALRKVEVLVSLELDALVMGVAPFGGDIAVLAYPQAGSSPQAAPQQSLPSDGATQPPAAAPQQPAVLPAALAADQGGGGAAGGPQPQSASPSRVPARVMLSSPNDPDPGDTSAAAAEANGGDGLAPPLGAGERDLAAAGRPQGSGQLPELKILTWQNEEVASDALMLGSLLSCQAEGSLPRGVRTVSSWQYHDRTRLPASPADFALTACYWPSARAEAASSSRRTTGDAGSQRRTADVTSRRGTADSVGSVYGGGHAQGSRRSSAEADGGWRKTAEAAGSDRHAAGASGASSEVGSGPSSREFKRWWADGEEPTYYVISPKDIIVGRPRDGDDRIAWLLEHARFQQALDIIDADPTLKAATRVEASERYLNHLIRGGRFDDAARLMPRLVQDDAAAWERWVYLFAQLRQLPALAPYLPTGEPELRPAAYQMVLQAFLLAPADHASLLALVKAWPSRLYSVPGMTEAVLQRARAPGGDTDELLQVAAELYQLQGRHDLALAIFLRQQRPAVFDFIEQHGLLPALRDRVAQLMSIDEARATALLVSQQYELPPQVVVPALQAEEAAAAERKAHLEARQWRRRLHVYLDALFRADQSAGAEYHELQVALYAEFEPQRLMHLLVSSQAYSLEAAYEVCTARGLVREQVFILGRMGNATKALHLIIEQLGDIPQAIEFVQMQRDDELWELLISLSLGSAYLTGSLLDHIGGYVNPLRLVRRIPEGMAIAKLRDRLVHIVADFRTQTSLREGCNTILHTDCVLLAQKLYREVRRALHSFYVLPLQGRVSGRTASSSVAMGQWVSWDAVAGPGQAVTAEQLPGPQGSTAEPAGRPPAYAHGEADSKVWVGNRSQDGSVGRTSSVAPDGAAQQPVSLRRKGTLSSSQKVASLDMPRLISADLT